MDMHDKTTRSSNQLHDMEYDHTFDADAALHQRSHHAPQSHLVRVRLVGTLTPALKFEHAPS